MSQTIINVNGKLHQTEYQTPIANASDIYDATNEKSVQDSINSTNNNVALQSTKIDNLNTVGTLVETSNGNLANAYSVGDIFYRLEGVRDDVIKHYYVAKNNGLAGDNIYDSNKFIDAEYSSTKALNIKSTVIKDHVQGDDAYGVYVKQWAQDHPGLEPTQENGFLEQDEWLESLVGDDAYEIAVEEGFEGSKSDWLASLKGDKGDNAVNPFKGWYNAITTGTPGTDFVVTDEDGNLVEAYPTPVIGDYAYIKTWDIDTTRSPQVETPITKIYECTTAGTWSDSGRTADTSNVQTFASSEEVNETYIDDTHLVNPKNGALPRAEDVKVVVADDVVADLDIADNNGKVIMRLANGEVATKNFNSESTPAIGDAISVLDIADSQGNVVMRIDSIGNIFTFGFDSTKVLLKDAVNSVSDSINAFVGKMNEYAADFGMVNTHFLNASGQNKTGHYSTAKDIMRMCACCTAYEKLMRYWGLETFTFHVAGANARDISVESSYKGSAMESVGDYYHIYGGKSGTWQVSSSLTVRNLTLVVKSNMDDAWLVGCVIKSSVTDRGVPFKQLIDWLEAYRQDPTTTTPTINADYAAAAVVQPHNPMAYADVDYCLVSKNGDTQYLPASMTKLMTAMVVLDYCSLDETLTIIASDIQSGSGSTFYAGDKISIADAVPAMLLPSSNTLAVALSRFVGNKIINIKNK